MTHHLQSIDTPLAQASASEHERLAGICEDVLTRIRARGASDADVSATIDAGLDVNVRLGEVETITRNRDRGLAVTVYFGHRKGSASTADLAPDSIEQTIEQACAIARYTEEDPANGLADANLMAQDFPDLDLWHPWDITPEEAIDLARRVEDAGRSHDARISNSEGASVQVGSSWSAEANSRGFLAAGRDTRHSIACALIAEDGDGMQRDYWYDAVRASSDFAEPESIGRRAAERAVARLHGRSLSTREASVLFVPELARGLIGHALAAVSGGSLYRRASFLLDSVGTKIFPDFMQITERPRLMRGQGSGNFDADGVATRDADLVSNGVLQRYILGSYSARKLGLQTTANAGGVHNLLVTTGDDDFAAMIRRMGTGLVVTELMGQGVSVLTGDYSRGAAGFWVENGEIAYPVEEITIASNLKQMYQGIVAIGNDIDRRSHILTGSILIDRMMIAGE